MLEIRRGTPADYPLLMKQVVESFRINTPWHNRFEVNYPDMVRPDAESMAQWRLAFVDGELAGGLILVPRRLKIGATEITFGGIGHVHCWPKFRKEGVFTAIMQRAIQDMEAEGIPLSMLSGDRFRYGHFGWELAGSQREAHIWLRARRFDGPAERPDISEFREYLGDDEDTVKIMKAAEKSVSHPVRSLEETRRVLQCPNRVTYLYDHEGVFAYMTFRGPAILEYGGEVDGVDRILRYALHAADMTVTLPPEEASGELEDLFMKYTQYYVIQTAEQVRVNSLQKTLAAYLPWLEERLQGWTGRRVLAIEGGEKVAIQVADGKVTILPTEESADLTLSQMDVAPFLLGPSIPTAVRKNHDAFWRTAFPLPFYWPPLTHV